MAIDSSTISGILKRRYSPAQVENLQNMDAPTLKKLKKGGRKITGNGLFFSVNLEGNQRGQGSQNELEALRTPASQGPQQGNIQNKIFTHHLQFSGLSLEIAKGDEESFVDNMTFQVEEGIRDSKKELNAQLFRSGSGKLADVNGSISGSTSLVFDGGVGTHFRVGEYIDVILTGSKEIDSVKITGVDLSTNTLTLATSSTCTNNAEIFREDVNDNAPTEGKELSGFKLMTDDGTLLTTYEGISRATYAKWDGLSINMSSANLSDDALQRGMGRVQVESGRKPSKLIMNPNGQFRKYLSILTPAKEFYAKDKMDSGYEQVPTWNGIEVLFDTDCGFDEVYMMTWDLIEMYDTHPLQLDQADGDVLKHKDGYDAFYAIIKHYGNVGTRVPNAHIRLHTFATPTY